MKKETDYRKEQKMNWFLVNAQDKILGRLAVRVSRILSGKNKPAFTPGIDSGDGVIVINASKVRVTGRKLQQKIYQRYSGYPSGKKEVTLGFMLANKPATLFRLAVKRMLPKNKLAKNMLRRLKVYPDDKHLHQAQNPKVLEV